MKRFLGRLVSNPQAPAPPGPPLTSTPVSPSAVASGTDAAGPPRPLDVRALRSLVTDADELRKGTEVFDKGGLAHLARHGERIFCEAVGSCTDIVATVVLPLRRFYGHIVDVRPLSVVVDAGRASATARGDILSNG